MITNVAAEGQFQSPGLSPPPPAGAPPLKSEGVEERGGLRVIGLYRVEDLGIYLGP